MSVCFFRLRFALRKISFSIQFFKKNHMTKKVKLASWFCRIEALLMSTALPQKIFGDRGKLMHFHLIATIFALATYTSVAKADTPVTFQRSLDVMQFRGFVNGWDDYKYPVICAAMGSLDDWKEIMSGSPRQTSSQYYDSDAAVFSNQIFLMASRVMFEPPGDWNAVFSVNKVTVKDGVVSVDYTYRAPKEPKDLREAQYKNFFMVAIPKTTPSLWAVRFIENGRAVCSTVLN